VKEDGSGCSGGFIPNHPASWLGYIDNLFLKGLSMALGRLVKKSNSGLSWHRVSDKMAAQCTVVLT